MILFLDIDGVLHPDPATIEQAFCCRHLLWKILIARPNLKVVISSDWRLHHPLSELIDFIISDGMIHLKQRIIDVTPVIPNAKHEYRGREKECLNWLEKNGNNIQSWIALDDIAGNYTYGSPHLFLINHETGLTDNDVQLILSKI